MSVMGVWNNYFKAPVCNSFQAKILNDQLCYEVDLNKIVTNSTSDELMKGLELIVDTNDNRQTNYKNSDIMIYFDTLGSVLPLSSTSSKIKWE